MEPLPPLARYASRSSSKRVFTASGSGSGGSSALMDEDLVEISPPPSFPKSRLAKQKQLRKVVALRSFGSLVSISQDGGLNGHNLLVFVGKGMVISHEVIDVDKYGDVDDLIIMDEKSFQNSKGKRAASGYYASDVDVAPTDMAPAPKGVGSVSRELNIGGKSGYEMSILHDNFVDLDYNEVVSDDECAKLQFYCDNMDIPPGVEAHIPWWPPSEGSENQGAPDMSADFLTLGSHIGVGAPKIDDSKSLHTYKESLQADTQGSKSKRKSVSSSSSGAAPHIPWHPFASHEQQNMATWATDHPLHPLGTTQPSWIPPVPGMVAGNPLPPEIAYSTYSNLVKMQGFNPMGSHPFPGWGMMGGSGPTFPASHTLHTIAGEIPFINDPSVGLERGIAAEISVPTDLASSDQKDDSEASIIKRLELFKRFDTVQDHSDHHFSCKKHSQPTKAWVKKIQDEWRILEKDLPETIFVRVYETRMDLLRAVIIGAEGTPYHDGVFFFDVQFPSSYPNVPPLVHYHSGGLRLNPNLYNCGKVCLSLLNTWSGGAKEKWIPGLSTALQVLVSIQGLILNAKPYFNEPGYAGMAGTPAGAKRSEEYNENTFLLSLKTMLYSMRRPPKYFEDFVFGHFYKYGHEILIACKAYLDGAQVGTLVKGGIQDVDEGDKSCSNTFKMHLPVYINDLVKAFTKIGVKDCGKFTISVNKNNAEAENTSGGSSSSSRRRYHRKAVPVNHKKWLMSKKT